MIRIPSDRRAGLVVAVAVFPLLAAAAGRLALEPESARRAAAAPVVTLEPVASGLGQITGITNARDDRLFVTVQTGQILILSNGQALATPFLDISSKITCCGERGLLSVAFHPNYANNGFFFVYYTDLGGDIAIARYRRSALDANQAEPTSGVVLLSIPHPGFGNHNGGQLQFGPDGFLYVGTGDGGSANDPPCNAQRTDVLLGKLLRIDVDQNVNAPPFYGIPPENPYGEPGGPRDEIWATGLRNPWRFGFDRLTGDLWIGDVGQGEREEIDFQPYSSHGGENYGWKIMEGTRCGDGGSSACPADVPPCGSPTFVAPKYEYTHAAPGVANCAVIGGFVYRGGRAPSIAGRYVYGDLCSGRLWADTDLLSPAAPNVSTFGEDLAGDLYLGTQNGGVFRFADPNAPTPGPTVPRLPVLPPERREVTPIFLERSS